MDTENNEYKRIVNTINKNKTLEKSIGSYIEKNYEEESKIDYHKAKKIRTRRAILTSIFIALLIASLVFIIVGSLYPLTPSGVVKRYLFEVENGDFERAEKYIKAEHEIAHDFFETDEFSFKITYNEHRHPKDKTKSTVDLWIEYIDEEVDEFLFWLSKIDGKWYITSRKHVVYD